jgi:hypothetical protein
MPIVVLHKAAISGVWANSLNTNRAGFTLFIYYLFILTITQSNLGFAKPVFRNLKNNAMLAVHKIVKTAACMHSAG